MTVSHEMPDEPQQCGAVDDDMHVVDIFDVRHADHDLGAFADRIAVMVAEDEPTIIDVSGYEEGGNRIVLRSNRPPEEPAT